MISSYWILPKPLILSPTSICWGTLWLICIKWSTHSWIKAFLKMNTADISWGAPRSSVEWVKEQSLIPYFSWHLSATFQTASNQAPGYLLMNATYIADKDSRWLSDSTSGPKRWERMWAMAFHLDKCSTLWISKSRKLINASYTLAICHQPLQKNKQCELYAESPSVGVSWIQMHQVPTHNDVQDPSWISWYTPGQVLYTGYLKDTIKPWAEV